MDEIPYMATCSQCGDPLVPFTVKQRRRPQLDLIRPNPNVRATAREDSESGWFCSEACIDKWRTTR
jgi:hypothetical protein